ncbi:hypothetical protein WJX81_007665 [Elliptochloris bilobata]|uniref:Uncharacterized protein n=1 Tax=Elliptochloris bilobata TaxID=381761 RepID=A0AAW1SIY8_9CHLO
MTGMPWRPISEMPPFEAGMSDPASSGDEGPAETPAAARRAAAHMQHAVHDTMLAGGWVAVGSMDLGELR